MAANSKLKLKPLYIMKILMEQTDEQHPLTVNGSMSVAGSGKTTHIINSLNLINLCTSLTYILYLISQ